MRMNSLEGRSQHVSSLIQRPGILGEVMLPSLPDLAKERMRNFWKSWEQDTMNRIVCAERTPLMAVWPFLRVARTVSDRVALLCLWIPSKSRVHKLVTAENKTLPVAWGRCV